MSRLQVLQSGTLGAVPANWVIVGTGDFNGDGNTTVFSCRSKRCRPKRSFDRYQD